MAIRHCVPTMAMAITGQKAQEGERVKRLTFFQKNKLLLWYILCHLFVRRFASVRILYLNFENIEKH